MMLQVLHYGWKKWEVVMMPTLYYYINHKINTSTTRRNDFCLAIQTPLQATMMTTFGNNILCIDSTRKTTGYDFPLITILVIDEFGERYPVAWCFSPSLLLDIFLSYRKELVQ